MILLKDVLCLPCRFVFKVVRAMERGFIVFYEKIDLVGTFAFNDNRVET